MFDPVPEGGRLFALPPGVDFAAQTVRGLLDRVDPTDPMALARVELFVNTHRMQRRIQTMLTAQGARLLPRIRLVTDPGQDPTLSDLPPAVPPLRRRLELTALIARLLESEPDLAPRSALFSLSASLSALLSEMHGEGVPLAALAQLDVSDESGHWARALRFVQIAFDYIDRSDAPDPEARARAAILAQITRWQSAPPDHPVIVAGSTASRGTTALLIEAVARLPQGAVILPGVDPHMPPEIWRSLSAGRMQDHPQYRFARLAEAADCAPESLHLWTQTLPPNADRNALLSLALRPAPVTDGWLRDGPSLSGLPGATERVTLLEAPSPRIEAEAIALRLRQAAQDGQVAAVVTPDRVLTRQIAVALDRWGIVPDDSAGVPLQLSPVGRILRHSAEFLTEPPSAERLLVLLKHPLSASGSARGPHLRWSRELELSLRRYGPPDPSPASMEAWAARTKDAAPWAAWVAGLLGQEIRGTLPLTQILARHLEFVRALCAGPDGGPSALWQGDAGEVAERVMTDLGRHAEVACDMTTRDYTALLSQVLSGEEVRRADLAHPGILIWGTLEARVQSADLVILAGLNEGTWPEAPSPDPWLNRQMRARAGLLVPDRSVGLAAHDFQLAMGAPEVWITRAERSDEAETVPSRWVNRLTNLLDGLEQGRPCLQQMRARAAPWIARAEAQDRPLAPVPPARRPSPRPPVAARPTRLRVTDVAQLLRDPYAIYAREVLGLRAVDPLVMSADARTKGIAIHEVMERFVQEVDPDAPEASARLLDLTETVLRAECPWPTARALWAAQMVRNAAQIVAQEAQRRQTSEDRFVEISGQVSIGPVQLHGRADRIDIDAQGRAQVYDYKTGTPPSVAQQKALDKQLLVEAAMIEQGGFAAVGPVPVAGAAYLQIGAKLAQVNAPLAELPPPQVWDDLHRLFGHWMRPEQGYTARMAAQSSAFGGAYDQLARYGEWDSSQAPVPEDLT